ncbi:MAG: redoxin domain-containing protein [Actinobacteria bacterium]|nr:redoxin domain-containing protein [Actinomycetota bacterium]
MSHPSPVGAGRPAPELAVRGTGPGAVTIGELADGGCALLLFVSEECPTSALALRRLGPLCRDWEAAGLASAAVFEDPLAAAVRVARRLGWTGRVLSQEPPYPTSRAYGLVSVPTAVLVDRAGTVAGTVTGWDQPSLQALVGKAGALLRARLTAPPAAQPLQKPGCASKAALDPELAAAMSAPAGTDDIEEMFERGWTDGLPVVPPTADRVEAMLGGAGGSESLGPVPPALGEATLARVAACAVLAGCRPAYFPVVVAAARAVLDPAFNLRGQAVTTQPAGQLVVVNGPVREAIGLNSGIGALGPGFRANLTIGRALRLLVTLTGQGVPGKLDRATLGHMGKVGFCLAEDEEASPWPPLHAERGFRPDQSVVTVIGCDAPLSVSEHRSRTPEDLAHVLGWAAASAWSTNWWPLEEPQVFVICPEHAEMFRAAGWTKQRLRRFMFEAVRKPAAELRRGETTPFVHAADPAALVPKWASPEAIVLVVAGGEAGRFSAVLGPCSGMGYEIVSREVVPVGR